MMIILCLLKQSQKCPKFSITYWFRLWWGLLVNNHNPWGRGWQNWNNRMMQERSTTVVKWDLTLSEKYKRMVVGGKIIITDSRIK